MVLGNMIGVETGAVVRFGNLETVLVEIRQLLPGAIEMIEDAEFHDYSFIPRAIVR